MYMNFLNDRKSLGYECLIDTQCGNQLVLITNSSILLVRYRFRLVYEQNKQIISVVIICLGLTFS